MINGENASTSTAKTLLWRKAQNQLFALSQWFELNITISDVPFPPICALTSFRICRKAYTIDWAFYELSCNMEGSRAVKLWIKMFWHLMFLLKEKLGKLSAPDQGEFNLINILTPEGYEGICQMNLNIEFIQKWFCCKAQEIEKSVFRQELFHQRRLNESSYIALENLSMNDWFAIDCRSYVQAQKSVWMRSTNHFWAEHWRTSEIQN